MEELLAGILTADFWLGFVGAVVATAFLTQPVMSALCGRCGIPRRILGPLVAIIIGTLVAWLWATIGDDGLKVRALIRDGIVNGAASSLVYENIIKPWLERRAKGLGRDPEVTN